MCEFRVGKPKTQERARGPTHTRRIHYRMEIPAPSDNDCVALGIWHTSSKGMPRHAHGRWALMQAGGRCRWRWVVVVKSSNVFQVF